MATWQEEFEDRLKEALGMSNSGRTMEGSEAALMGGGAAGAFKAQQMANAKAADLARAAGQAPANTALSTTGGAGGASAGNLITQGEGATNQLAKTATRRGLIQKGTEIIKGAAEPGEMRNVTPRAGAGLSGLARSGGLVNPVTALFATTTDLGRGDYVVETDDVLDPLGQPMSDPQGRKLKKPKEVPLTVEGKMGGGFGDIVTPTSVQPSAPAMSRESESTQRSPLERQMVAPKTPEPAAPAAPAAPASSRNLQDLFLKATGTKFDPKSRVDVARMAELQDFVQSKPEYAGKSDTQVSLQWYRQLENAKRKRK